MNIILKIKSFDPCFIRLRKEPYQSGVESKGSSKGGGREEQMRVQDHVLLTTAVAWNLDCLGTVVRVSRDTPNVASVDGFSGITDARPYSERRS